MNTASAPEFPDSIVSPEQADAWTSLPLAPRHAEHLAASGISPTVAKSRGYETIETKIALTRLGFGDAQAATVPGILMPLYGAGGELAGRQFRPDTPRMLDGRFVKYETPRKQPPVIDVPPAALGWVRDPELPLFVTEGTKKADAAATHELGCISVAGVSSWRGADALAALDQIPWKARTVYLVFDSDWRRKNQVRRELVRLARVLASRGADVRWLDLPEDPPGVKCGLDDYFARGGGYPALLRYAHEDIPPEVDDDEPEGRYAVRDGRICERRAGLGGEPSWVELAGFSARIAEERVVDDGLASRVEFVVTGALPDGSPLPTAEVPANSFDGMAWVTRHWGVRAVVAAGQGSKDKLREAIQRQSSDACRSVIYEQAGWRELPGIGWCFLHAGGAIGRDGAIPGVAVRLRGPAERVRLPDPPEGDTLRDAVRRTLQTLDVLPRSVAVPLMAAPMRAVLNECRPGDLAVWLTGPTGAFKTELGAVAMRYVGPDFDGTATPAQWSSTANALEYFSHVMNDLPFLVDDFAPGGDPKDVANLHGKAERVIRAAGNVGARSRLDRGSKAGPAYVPQCLLIGTGEDVPRGASLRARLVVVEIERGAVTPGMISELQREPARSSASLAMAGYLRWLAGHLPELKSLLAGEIADLRDRLIESDTHARTPQAMANLAVGWRHFVAYALDVGAISQADADRIWEIVWSELRMLSRAQPSHQRSEEPARLFLDALLAALAARRVHVAGRDGDEPSVPAAWGWHERVSESDDRTIREWQPGGERVGWLDGDDLYVDPGAAYQAVKRFDPAAVPTTRTTLLKRLNEAGFLRSIDTARGTLAVRRVLGGTRRGVLHFAPTLYPEEPDQSDHKTATGAPYPDPTGASGQRESDHETDMTRAANAEPDHTPASQRVTTRSLFGPADSNGRIGRVTGAPQRSDEWEDVVV